MSTPDDIAAKKRFIEAFFEDLRNKAGFTDTLYANGHEDEARLLVCCYIEALGNGLDPTDGQGARNFVNVLVEHGGDQTLALLLPKLLRTSLPYKSVAPADKTALETALNALPDTKALTATDLVSAVTPLVSSAALTFLQRELWRARVAMVAYSNVRSLGAHWFGSPGAVSFSQTTYQGKALPEIDFSTLRQALDRVIVHVATLSLDTAKWFGRF